MKKIIFVTIVFLSISYSSFAQTKNDFETINRINNELLPIFRNIISIDESQIPSREINNKEEISNLCEITLAHLQKIRAILYLYVIGDTTFKANAKEMVKVEQKDFMNTSQNIIDRLNFIQKVSTSVVLIQAAEKIKVKIII